MIRQPPVRMPHHTISVAGLLGGGDPPRPGEVSLAHRGVLVLDELPEFAWACVEGLGEPLEDGAVTIVRARYVLHYPARFQLMAAMNLCPCGGLGHPERVCTDSPAAVRRYQGRVSGPVLDRMDLVVPVAPLTSDELAAAPFGEPSAVVRERIVAARARQAERLATTPWERNAEIPATGKAVERLCPLMADAEKLLHSLAGRRNLSTQAVHRVRRVARTIGDLRSHARPLQHTGRSLRNQPSDLAGLRDQTVYPVQLMRSNDRSWPGPLVLACRLRQRAGRLPIAALPAALLLSACFDDIRSDTPTSTSASTEDSDPGDGTDTEATGSSTEAETGGCPDLGCSCEDENDCVDGLACVGGVCSTIAICGDSVPEAPEKCDDGNTVDGDGCDNDCTYTELLTVDAGGAHTCVLIEGGRVKCWGLNTFGQLGLGNTTIIGDDELPSDIPDVQLPGPAVEVSAGLAEHTCARLADQSVYCWGRNNAGQLGLGHLDDIGDDEGITTPTPVGVDIAEIEVGSFQTCARGVDQSVYCWGLGFFGQLGYGNLQSIGDDELPSAVGPVPVGGPVKEIAVGGSHTCALSLLGTIYCWGFAEFGELGYGNIENVGDDEFPSEVGSAPVVPKGLTPGANGIQLSAGVYSSCAVFEDGEALCWGDGSNGQLGQVDTENLGDDEPPSDALPIGLPAPVSHLTAGGAHVCALLESGEAYCWGSAEFGQLGYGNVQNIGDDEPPSAGGPLDIGGDIRVLDAGFFHTCAISELNELRCWGNNDAGQLGQGNTNTLGDSEALTDIPPVSVF